MVETYYTRAESLQKQFQSTPLTGSSPMVLVTGMLDQLCPFPPYSSFTWSLVEIKVTYLGFS